MQKYRCRGCGRTLKCKCGKGKGSDEEGLEEKKIGGDEGDEEELGKKKVDGDESVKEGSE